MRHGKRGRKFHRLKSRRTAFLRNLASDLIRAEKIRTTEARAKEIRPIVERLITIAKRQNLSARRLLISRLHNERVVRKLYDVLAPRYGSRVGGYLRIKKTSIVRRRDGSQLSTIEFV